MSSATEETDDEATPAVLVGETGSPFRVSSQKEVPSAEVPILPGSTRPASVLHHPVVVLLSVVVGAATALRALFFWQSDWLWHFARVVHDADITPWALWALKEDRDGAEPYALLAFVFVSFAAAAAAGTVFSRFGPRAQTVVVPALLGLGAILAYQAPPRPPLSEVAPVATALLVVVASLLFTLLLQRGMRFRRGVLVILAFVFIPVCLLRTHLPGRLDLFTILSPALRLQHGFSLREVYLQYDLLPSLLALGWLKAGRAPLGFVIVVAAGYYVMLLGLFVLARRLFGRASLAAPLLCAVVLARLYASQVDPGAVPQSTPIRLELWLLLLATALGFGLEHWLVGLALGILCLLSRSIATLYLGAYVLALAADFLARRRAATAASRLGLVDDLRQSARRVAPAVACILACLLAARWLFGSLSSDAVALYRQYGVGMLPIERGSFYWWLLPLTGAVGWLAFSRRSALLDRRGQAAIFAVALVVVNSLYFFGRSHEHNLINLGTSFLLCAFLGLDLAWPSLPTDPRPLLWGFRSAPWLIVGVSAYFYSARIVAKVEAQYALLAGPEPLVLGVSKDSIKIDRCREIKRAAGDARLYFFSKKDFFFYHDCGFVPHGYIQPMRLSVLREPLIAEMNGLLDAGYKIVVPRERRDSEEYFAEFRGALLNTAVKQTRNYRVYRRAAAPAGP